MAKKRATPSNLLEPLEASIQILEDQADIRRSLAFKRGNQPSKNLKLRRLMGAEIAYNLLFFCRDAYSHVLFYGAAFFVSLFVFKRERS